MPPDSGRTIFAVARVAGWAAHYLEELTERPVRFRARAVYTRVRSRASLQPAPITMADGCPPRWMAGPSVPVARVTGTSPPACWVTHAVAPSALSATPWAASGSAIGVPTAGPSAVCVTGTRPVPPHT